MLGGAMTCGVMISRQVAAVSSRFPPTLPLSSMNRIHFAISLTLDQTEPAGATASTDRLVMGRIVSRMSACGVATLGWPASAASVGSVAVIPSGTKMRVRRKVAHGMPEAAAMTSPAIAYMMFWYMNPERSEYAGWSVATRREISSGV